MPVHFIKSLTANGARALENLTQGAPESWRPAFFKVLMKDLSSNLAKGLLETESPSSVVVAVEAEEVDHLGRPFIEHLEALGIRTRLACFWMRRRGVRDRARTIIATSCQQYVDPDDVQLPEDVDLSADNGIIEEVEELVILQPVAARPDFAEFAFKRLGGTQRFSRVILVAPIVHPRAINSAIQKLGELYEEPSVVGCVRIDDDTGVIGLTRYGSEGLLHTTRSNLKTRYFPEFMELRMNLRKSHESKNQRSGPSFGQSNDDGI